MVSYKNLKLFIASFFVIVVSLFLIFPDFWVVVAKVYIAFAFLFVFVRFSLWGYAELFPMKYEKNLNSYTVVLPVKDEDPRLFIACIKSIIRQKGEKQILIGDDGSAIPVKEVLKDYPELLKEITLLRSNLNIGKKEMQIKLFKLAKYDLCVQMDSDIILRSNYTLLRLCSPFSKNNKIGITNGQTFIKSNGSLIHRLQDFMSLCSYEIGRQSMGRVGINPCCSGELMAFRLDIFMNFIEEYKNTKFVGKIMKFGEDRFMTNIFLREGFKSIMVKEATATAFPMNSLKELLKQQHRWKKSGIRESIRCAKTCGHNNLYLPIWSILNFSLPIMFFLIVLAMVLVDLIILQFYHLLIFMAAIITISFIVDLPLILKYPRLIPMVIPFLFYNIFLITPLWTIAIFNLDDVNWGTR